ncbi:hypothetical protein SLS62_008720 [Diatrype stigma]|uniref:Luciferase domain-containing protein n=1 Tax=Diatrype stigma TaxID=117547 RepID=A0AAN9YMS1_9PEZI
MSLPERLSSLVRGPGSASHPLHHLLATLRANRALATGLAAATALLAAAGLAPLAARTISDYRAWLAVDAGGLPHNFFGYLVNVAMQPFARSDTRAVPAPYASRDASVRALYGAEAYESYLSSTTLPLPARRGPRPDVPRFTAPQRQTTQMAVPYRVSSPSSLSSEVVDDILERQVAFLAAVAAANPGVARRAPSAAEGGYHQALWLADGPGSGEGSGEGKGKGGLVRPRWMGMLRGEFAHPHGEGSAHVVLSLTDAATLIEKGWAERHPLSGVRGFLPWGFVFVYAPRDEDELAVWKDIVLASVRFVATAAAAPGSGKQVIAMPEE